MSEANNDQVFLSYARENLETVKNVVLGLKRRKIHVWFDKERLAPGPWKPQIIKAITRSRYFIICISEATLSKTGEKPGFQDHELQTAYEIAQAQPVQNFTIVPVRLEDCKRGDFRISSFQQYDLFPDFEKGLDNLAVHIGGVSLSDATLEDERSEHEKIIESLLGKSYTAYYAYDFKKALTLTKSILAFDLNNAEAWHIKGIALGSLDLPEEALQAFDKALELNPEDDNIWYNKSVTLGSLGRHEEELLALDKALELDPEYDLAWASKGVTLGELGRHEEALQAHDKALELNPDNVFAWTSKGVALVILGLNKEALQAFYKALELKPEDDIILYNIGIALGNLDLPEEALQAFDKALELNPNSANAWTSKGVTLGELGRYEEALQAHDKALELDPEDGNIWFNKLVTLGNLGYDDQVQITAKGVGKSKPKQT